MHADEVALRPSELSRSPSITTTEEPNPKCHEQIRVDGRVKDPGKHLTAYERYLRYGTWPRKKNARKRVASRIRNHPATVQPFETTDSV